MADYMSFAKLLLSNLGPIITATTPIFTKKSDAIGVDVNFQQNQIAELQSAVNENAKSLKIIAEQVQKAVTGLDERDAQEQGFIEEMQAEILKISERQSESILALAKLVSDMQTTKYIAVVAIVISIIGIGVVLLK